MTATRRQFLTGRITDPAPEFRPPWTTDADVRARCTGCGDCARACGQGIVEMVSDLPRIRFAGQECTFCGDCVSACPEDVFDKEAARPWPVTVELGAGCLLPAGIACRVCTDACDQTALRFDLRVRPVGAILVDVTACTGCAACLPACPTGSLTLRDDRMKEAAA